MSTKWQAFKATVQATWFWRVYGIRAMKRKWTKYLLVFALFNTWMVIYGGIDRLTPILELKQLHQEEGILLSVYSPKRQAAGSKLVIRTNSGEKVTYLGSIYSEEKSLDAVIGQKITVWSQPVYEAWYPPYYQCFWQVAQGEKILIDYHNGEGRKYFRESYAAAVFFFYAPLALAIFSLLRVTWVCRKGECE